VLFSKGPLTVRIVPHRRVGQFLGVLTLLCGLFGCGIATDDSDSLDDETQADANHRDESVESRHANSDSGPLSIQPNTESSQDNPGQSNSRTQERPKGEPPRKGSLADLIETLEPAVVRINVNKRGTSAIGSGFVVDENGLIVTNYHVVQGARTATATFANGTSFDVEGFRLLSPEKDIAILQLAKPNGKLPFIRLAERLPRKGDSTVTLGAPKGLSFSASQGIVSAIRKDTELSGYGLAEQGTWIQTTAPISPGNSGGPLVSSEGLVIGANTWTVTTGQNLNFAISSLDIREAVVLSQTKKTERFSAEVFRNASPANEPRKTVGSFRTTQEAFGESAAAKFSQLWFGAAGIDLSKKDLIQLSRAGVRTRKGLYVTVVGFGSPAYEAGLRSNDIIKRVNGQFVETLDDLTKVIASAKHGQILKVEALKRAAKGRYQVKPAQLSVQVRNLIPLYATRYVSQLECPPEVKEFLFLQLLGYADLLSSASRLATQNGSAREYVSVILQTGPFNPILGPDLGRGSAVRVGTIGRADDVEILQVVGDRLVRFEIGRATILMRVDATNITDGDTVTIGVARIVGTQDYTTVIGASRKAFVAERFDLQPFLPDANELKRMIAESAVPDKPVDQKTGSSKRDSVDKSRADEVAASGQLRLAKKLIENSADDAAKRRLLVLVEKYPKTNAAKEAKVLLEKLDE